MNDSATSSRSEARNIRIHYQQKTSDKRNRTKEQQHILLGLFQNEKDAFFWVTFHFRNERNTILVIPSPKVEWTESFWKWFIRKDGISQKSVLFAKYLSSRCSFDSSLPLIVPRQTLPTNKTVFRLLILLLDNILSNSLFSSRAFSFWNSTKRMHPKTESNLMWACSKLDEIFGTFYPRLLVAIFVCLL